MVNPSFQYYSKVVGTGSSFPKKILTNDDLTKMVDTSNDWIIERTGIEERRIREPGNKEEFLSSLATLAAKKALEAANLSPLDIDAIIVGTLTPDTNIPNTACWIQEKLGAKNAWAVDLNAACSGFVYSMSMADQFIKTGMIKRALLIGGDILSSITNWEDRNSCILFGDAAGAVILEATTPDDPNRILSSHLKADGTFWEVFVSPAAGSNVEITHEVLDKKEHKMQMKGREIFKVAVKTLADFAERAIEANGLKPSDVDWFIPHQANLRIIEAVAKRMDFPMEKVIVNIRKFGNTSSATIPTAFDQAIREGKIKRGDLVLMDTFGAGLTFGSLLLRY